MLPQVAFAAMLGNCDSKILPTKFLVSSEDCIRDLTNRHRLFSIQVAEYTSFSHQARKLKTNLSSLVSNFSKYYCKTGTICLLFLSSYIFTTLEFDMNHFGILLWKIVKPCDHDEIKPTNRKIYWKYEPIRHYFVVSHT